MIISGTGHRPNHPKMGGYNLPNPVYSSISQQIESILKELTPTKVISGFAQGFDLWLANVAVKLNIPLVAAVPFEGQESVCPEKSKRQYYNLLSKAVEVVIVSPGSYAAYKMQVRNQYLVDNCDILLACFDPETISGGTYNCIQYAKKIGKDIKYLQL